jgi:hypothetical protein
LGFRFMLDVVCPQNKMRGFIGILTSDNLGEFLWWHMKEWSRTIGASGTWGCSSSHQPP